MREKNSNCNVYSESCFVDKYSNLKTIAGQLSQKSFSVDFDSSEAARTKPDTCVRYGSRIEISMDIVNNELLEALERRKGLCIGFSFTPSKVERVGRRLVVRDMRLLSLGIVKCE